MRKDCSVTSSQEFFLVNITMQESPLKRKFEETDSESTRHSSEVHIQEPKKKKIKIPSPEEIEQRKQMAANTAVFPNFSQSLDIASVTQNNQSIDNDGNKENSNQRSLNTEQKNQDTSQNSSLVNSQSSTSATFRFRLPQPKTSSSPSFQSPSSSTTVSQRSFSTHRVTSLSPSFTSTLSLSHVSSNEKISSNLLISERQVQHKRTHSFQMLLSFFHSYLLIEYFSSFLFGYRPAACQSTDKIHQECEV
jgi:hypothetical protein